MDMKGTYRGQLGLNLRLQAANVSSKELQQAVYSYCKGINKHVPVLKYIYHNKSPWTASAYVKFHDHTCIKHVGEDK